MVTLRRDPPDGYPIISWCTSCGRDFTSDQLFDRHRVGAHAYTFSEGLELNPPREDGRRCLDAGEMLEHGWAPYTDEEMLASARHKRRAGHEAELWHDPARDKRVARAFNNTST